MTTTGGTEPEKIIDGWDPPVLNDHLMFRIAAAIAQIGDISVNGTLEGEGCTKLDSHTNMCVCWEIIYIYCLSCLQHRQ